VYAHRPEELPLVFRHYLNAGDLAGLMTHYYADNATYAPVPGVVVAGDEVEPAIARLVSLRMPIEVSVRHVLEACETALIVLDWSIPAAGMTGTATDVARRQPDGTWKCIIDNPHGGARSVDLPEATAAALAG
jgi:ketosteroid isomerase-like protein